MYIIACMLRVCVNAYCVTKCSGCSWRGGSLVPRPSKMAAGSGSATETRWVAALELGNSACGIAC